MLDCGVDDLKVLWHNRVMFLEMCSILTVGHIQWGSHFFWSHPYIWSTTVLHDIVFLFVACCI